MAASCAPVPVRSHTMISSSVSRPGFVPDQPQPSPAQPSQPTQLLVQGKADRWQSSLLACLLTVHNLAELRVHVALRHYPGVDG